MPPHAGQAFIDLASAEFSGDGRRTIASRRAHRTTAATQGSRPVAASAASGDHVVVVVVRRSRVVIVVIVIDGASVTEQLTGVRSGVDRRQQDAVGEQTGRILTQTVVP
jgi:hypothetical protein